MLACQVALRDCCATEFASQCTDLVNVVTGSPALEMPATKSPTYTLDDWEDVAARECLVGVYEKANAKAELRTTRSYLSRLYANVA